VLTVVVVSSFNRLVCVLLLCAGPSKYDATAGGGDKLMKREKPWDGIPGGQVGRVLLAPYWAPRWEIKKRLRARALKKKRLEEAIEMEKARKKALEEVAANKLRKMLEEEERLAMAAETERERELEEAKKLAMKQVRGGGGFFGGGSGAIDAGADTFRFVFCCYLCLGFCFFHLPFTGGASTTQIDR
jgi:hypothetical protein